MKTNSILTADDSCQIRIDFPVLGNMVNYYYGWDERKQIEFQSPKCIAVDKPIFNITMGKKSTNVDNEAGE